MNVTVVVERKVSRTGGQVEVDVVGSTRQERGAGGGLVAGQVLAGHGGLLVGLGCTARHDGTLVAGVRAGRRPVSGIGAVLPDGRWHG